MGPQNTAFIQAKRFWKLEATRREKTRRHAKTAFRKKNQKARATKVHKKGWTPNKKGNEKNPERLGVKKGGILRVERNQKKKTGEHGKGGIFVVPGEKNNHLQQTNKKKKMNSKRGQRATIFDARKSSGEGEVSGKKRPGEGENPYWAGSNRSS